MVLTYRHTALGSTLVGVELPSVVQFRGIPYGRLSKRFASPEAVSSLPAELDCTAFGPRCPQIPVDIRHLLRIPPDITLPVEPEDEFKCLNLDVTAPKEHAGQKLPVLVWIHGGSQSVTFGSAASGLCDMSQIVSDSSNMGQPIIAVAIQYRLNIFAFGDENTSANLALQDQALALNWVQAHIAGFGGDPEAVTLFGESAGAVYCHAHLVTGAPARQVILSSGSLQLSPPQPRDRAAFMRSTLNNCLETLGDFDISTAPAEIMVQALEMSGIQSWFLQMEPSLEGWQEVPGGAERVLVSDVQNEAVLFRDGIWSMTAAEIVGIFDLAGEHSEALKRCYNIYPDRESSCKLGALDFINDSKFLLPVQELVQLGKDAKTPVYQCIIDEANPWQPSNGAHHAIDLVLLFGGFDLSFSPAAERTGEQMRRAWIRFINLQEPWSSGSCAAFGPYGMFQELNDAELKSRRPADRVKYLQSVGSEAVDRVAFSLARGRISLLN